MLECFLILCLCLFIVLSFSGVILSIIKKDEIDLTCPVCGGKLIDCEFSLYCEDCTYSVHG